MGESRSPPVPVRRVDHLTFRKIRSESDNTDSLIRYDTVLDRYCTVLLFCVGALQLVVSTKNSYMNQQMILASLESLFHKYCAANYTHPFDKLHPNSSGEKDYKKKTCDFVNNAHILPYQSHRD